MKTNFITQQKPIKILGMFRQLFGGASTWITIAIFVFTGVTAWNTNTMAEIRAYLPWLSIYTFLGFACLCMAFMMWMEHKFVQPAIMQYWNKMHYEQNNPLVKRQKALEQIILHYVIDEKAKQEVQKILDELDKE